MLEAAQVPLVEAQLMEGEIHSKLQLSVGVGVGCCPMRAARGVFELRKVPLVEAQLMAGEIADMLLHLK